MRFYLTPSNNPPISSSKSTRWMPLFKCSVLTNLRNKYTYVSCTVAMSQTVTHTYTADCLNTCPRD